MIRRATRDDIPRAGALLAHAFAADPFTRWLARGASLEPLYRALVRTRLGEVYTSSEGDGVAVWRAAGERRSARESLAMLVATIRTSGFLRFLHLLPALAMLDRHHAKTEESEPAELVAIGVASAARGRGVATRLVRAALEDIDARGVPVVLETSNERNLAFYERHGFRVTTDLALTAGPKVWFMRRAAIR